MTGQGRSRRLRRAGHRPPVVRVGLKSYRAVWAEVEMIGPANVTRRDLERWRTELMPTAFARICNRLDRTLIDQATNQARAVWDEVPLPFDGEVA